MGMPKRECQNGNAEMGMPKGECRNGNAEMGMPKFLHLHPTFTLGCSAPPLLNEDFLSMSCGGDAPWGPVSPFQYACPPSGPPKYVCYLSLK